MRPVWDAGRAGHHPRCALCPRCHSQSPRPAPKFCIFLHLVGGASQVDTFDLKEGRWTPDDFGIRKITPEVSMPVGLLPLTLAVKVTLAPTGAGLDELVRVVVLAALMTCDSAALLEAALPASPP